jgi:signal transduction histidine kinase
MSSRRYAVRLEQRLPLVVMLLVAVTLLGGLSAAYREVRNSAVLAAEQRLQRVGQQIAQLGQGAIQPRVDALRAAAAEPEVAALLLGQPDTATQRAVLARHAGGAPDLTRLLDRRGRPVGTAPTSESVPEQPPLFGPIVTEAATRSYWLTVPVVRGRDTLGYLSQRRVLVGGSAGRIIEDLVGHDVSIYIVAPAESVWIALDGSDAAAAPAVPEPEEVLQQVRPGVGPVLAAATAIPGTPWVVVAERPLAAVMQRPLAFLRRYTAITLVLLAVAGLCVWALSRWITRPIRELGRAAHDVAEGSYRRRVQVERDDEIGALGHAFNAMAARVEQAIGEARARTVEAQAADRAKSEFLATMSHEIRTPINAVMGFADLLEMDTLNERQQSYVDRIRRNARHLTKLVDEVLDLSRIEAGGMRVAAGRGSCADAVRSARGMLAADAERRQLELRVDAPETLMYAGDPQRVEQILLNLLANAVKFTPAGGCIEFRCSALPVGTTGAPESGAATAWCAFTVRDTGPGIPPEMAERIFEPFVQAESGYTRSYGGAGLGLAISRRMARLMGGDITVDSAAGAGSTFTLWLPAYVAPPALAPA